MFVFICSAFIFPFVTYGFSVNMCMGEKNVCFLQQTEGNMLGLMHISAGDCGTINIHPNSMVHLCAIINNITNVEQSSPSY